MARWRAVFLSNAFGESCWPRTNGLSRYIRDWREAEIPSQGVRVA